MGTGAAGLEVPDLSFTHLPAVFQDVQEVEGENPQPQQEPPLPGKKADPAEVSLSMAVTVEKGGRPGWLD